jgi:signal transduction histidine kinase
MLKLLHNFFFSTLLILPFVLKAQANKDRPSLFNGQTKTEFEESKLTDKAYALYNNHEEDKAYLVAHKLLKKLKTKHARTNTNLLLAYYFNKRSLIDSSLFYTNQALRNRFYALAYNLNAINYRNRGLIEESKKWHLKGIVVSRKFKEINLFYMHTHGLALTYSMIGDYENALTLFKQCLEHKENPEMIYGSYINMAEIYGNISDFDLSNSYLNKANTLCKKANNTKCQAIITLNLAANHQQQGEIDEAVLLYNESIKISDKNNYNRIALIARSGMGRIFISLKKYEDAKVIISSGLENAVKLGLLNQQTDIYDNLKDIAILQNDYESAFILVTKFFKIKDSINQLQKDKEINVLEVKYNTLQKDKEIKILQVENRNKKLDLKNQEEAIENLRLQEKITEKQNENKILALNNSAEKRKNEITILKKDQEIKTSEINRQKEVKRMTLISFVVLLIPIMGLLILYYQKLQTQSLLNKKQKEISAQKISSLINDQELKLIKASIQGQDNERKRIALELHDSIGGNLAAIKLQFSDLSENNNNIKTIYKQLDDTYKQVRSLSHNLIPEKFRQNDFIPLVKEYMKNIGVASNLTITVSAHPEKDINNIDKTLQNEMFSIFQELITNTIKHAKAKNLDIQLDLIDDLIYLVFEDDGRGFKSSVSKSGIGLTNIQTRLQDLNGTINIDSHPKRGTIINIEIPNNYATI